MQAVEGAGLLVIDEVAAGGASDSERMRPEVLLDGVAKL